MRRMKKFLGLGIIVLSLGMMIGCGAKSKDYAENTVDKSSGSVGQSTVPEMAKEGFTVYTPANPTAQDNADYMDMTNTSQKLIKRVSLNLETLEYDSLLLFLNNKITELGGYTEESNSYGKRLNHSNLRSAHMIVRIPSNRLNEFVDVIGENTTIVVRNESTEDATMQYVDTESRKKSLEIQQERLFALLEKAEKMEDVISLESRISQVTYELENYTSTLRTYDNLVQYGTVTIQIDEVERISNPQPKNVWERMSNGISDSMYNIKEGFKDFSVWVVSNLPYLIIWAIIVSIIVIVVKRKSLNKKNIYKLEVKSDQKPDDLPKE